MLFEGLSGFPITPINGGKVDLSVLRRIVGYIDKAGLDFIGVLGSTGSFAYLSELERTRVMECWSEATTPWIAGVSATTSAEAIRYCKIAHQQGAQGVIANAFAYIPLKPEELSTYFVAIADNSPLPLCVYDNPVTTGQSLSLALLQSLSEHPNIKSLKTFAKENNKEQHSILSAFDWQAGYAVDKLCCDAMIDGASVWFSTLAGTLPERVVPVMNAIKQGNYQHARALDAQNAPLYEIMQQNSGYRVMHALANLRGWKCEPPSPISMPTLPNLHSFLP